MSLRIGGRHAGRHLLVYRDRKRTFPVTVFVPHSHTPASPGDKANSRDQQQIAAENGWRRAACNEPLHCTVPVHAL